RLEIETQKLQAEQAQLVAHQQALAATRSANAPTERLVTGAYRGTSDPASDQSRGLQAEKDKREYESLFADNVAWSVPKEATATKQPTSQNTDDIGKAISLYSALAALQAANSRAGAAAAPPIPLPPDASAADERSRKAEADIASETGNIVRKGSPQRDS